MTAHTLTRTQARRRYAIVAIAIPLGFLVSVLIAQLAVLSRLPDPVAMHWGPDGVADGFGPRWALPLGTTGVGILITAFVAVMPFLGDAARATPRGGAMAYRLMAAITWAETALVGAVLFPSFLIQIDLADARDAHLPGWILLAALPLAALFGVVAWWITVEPPRTDRAADTPAAMPLAPTEQAVWIQRVAMSRGGALVLFGLGIAALVGIAAMWAAAAGSGEAPERAWSLGSSAVILLLVLAVLVSNMVSRVSVDDRGLQVRSALGWPRILIRREDIRSAEVVDVNPMGEYGGWGWRYGMNSGWGVVVRAGEAIRVRRANGKVFTVTVDDAATGAALLNGLVARGTAEAGR